VTEPHIYTAVEARALWSGAPERMEAARGRTYGDAGHVEHFVRVPGGDWALASDVLDAEGHPSESLAELFAAAPDLAATVVARALAAEERHAEAVSLALRLTATGEELLRDLDGARAELAALRGALARRVTDATRAGEPKHVLTPAGPGDRLKRRGRR